MKAPLGCILVVLFGSLVESGGLAVMGGHAVGWSEKALEPSTRGSEFADALGRA